MITQRSPVPHVHTCEGCNASYKPLTPEHSTRYCYTCQQVRAASVDGRWHIIVTWVILIGGALAMWAGAAWFIVQVWQAVAK